jgi:hypothetical protein
MLKREDIIDYLNNIESVAVELGLLSKSFSEVGNLFISDILNIFVDKLYTNCEAINKAQVESVDRYLGIVSQNNINTLKSLNTILDVKKKK